MTTPAQPDDPHQSEPLDLRDARTWPEFLTVDEVAVVLRMNPATVRTAIRAGTLPERGWTSSKRIAKRDLLMGRDKIEPEGTPAE